MTARKSDEIKKLAGTFRPQRSLPPDFAALLEELPVPPKHLSDGAVAQWRALCPAVIELGISRCDLVAFALLCETLWTAEETRREIERDGYMIAAGKTGHRLHPSAPIMQAARAQAQTLLTQFHLTPRARVGTATEMEERRLCARGLMAEFLLIDADMVNASGTIRADGLDADIARLCDVPAHQ
jgi:P27 family predicted phage terminase small subunit